MRNKYCFQLLLVCFSFFKFSLACASFPYYTSTSNLQFGITTEEARERIGSLETKDNTNFTGSIVTVGGIEYNTSLHFENNKLTGISYIAELKNKSFQESYKIYTDIGKELASEFGTPREKYALVFGHKKGEQIFNEKWSAEKTNILLDFSSHEKADRLWISYDIKETVEKKNDTSKRKNTQKRPETDTIPVFAEIPWYTNKDNVKKNWKNLATFLRKKNSNSGFLMLPIVAL